LNNSDDPSQKIKVVDRRRFTDDGELRPDRIPEEVQADPGAEPDEQAPAPEIPQPESAAEAPDQARAPGPQARQTPPEEGSGSAAATSQLFLELLGTLAQQAELLLTGAEGLPPQPDQAQRVIDYIGILESKTRGNLSVEESQILSNLVFQLRTLYVQKQS
jgi:hypothetical protein